MNTKPQLIINADDLGRSNFVNKNIINYFNARKITSSTIMANGNAFGEACEMINDNKLGDRIGVHLTLDEGLPLSDEMKKYTDNDGEMCLKRKMLYVNQDIKSAIYKELHAQINRVSNHGIVPTHLDSHRHIHTSFPIGKIVIALSKEFGIRFVRRARNLACNSVVYKGVYKWVFNRYLSNHTGTTDYFASLSDFHERYKAKCTINGTIECMCHLDSSAGGLNDIKLLQNPDFKQFINNFQLVDYSIIHTNL